MGLKLQQVEGGYSDGNISYLSGAGAPGGDTSYQDDAPVGSVYEDSTGLAKYRKVTVGTGTDKWAVSVASSDSVTQVSHGLVAGNWVYAGAAGYLLALGDDPATSDAIGIVDSVIDANNFVLITSGFSTIANVSTNGSPLYLDQSTAGSHTNNEPNIGILKPLGFAVDGLIFVSMGYTIEINDQEPPGVPLIVETAVTTLQMVDSVLCDDNGGVAWLIEVSDDANSLRYVGQVMAGHNGTTTADATEADYQEFGCMDFPVETPIAGLAIGVGLSGTDVTQAMELQIATTNSCIVSARRISI